MFTRAVTARWWAAAIVVIGAPSLAAAAPSEADRELVARVAARIFAQADPIEGWAWPPLVYIVNYEEGAIDEDHDGEIDRDEVNADADLHTLAAGESPKYPEGTSVTLVSVPGFEPIAGDAAADGTVKQPVIRIFQGWLTLVVQGEEARLANCFGHELAHVILHHVGEVETGAPLLENALQREQEAAADILGFKLAVAADYPYEALIASLYTERELLLRHTSFEAYNDRHPGYTDRVALVERNRTEVWRALAAFENGVFFLTSEQYPLAARCFEQVVERQSECYEAWANLGYAKLMMYCDAMRAEDLRAYDIGQLVVGGFYRRAGSLGIRGPREKFWEDAVVALQHALNLNPELVVARANLAAAYLVHPAGKDVGAAAEQFARVVAALERDEVEEGVDLRTKAALLVNAGVLEMADGDAAAAESLFARARRLLESDEEGEARESQVASAIDYNRAMMLARSGEPGEQRSAREDLEAYLASSSPAATWWSLAYEAYEKLSRDQGVEPKTREALAAVGQRQLRMVVGVELADGQMVAIDDPVEAVRGALGAGVESDVLRDQTVQRVRYLDQGLDLVCNDRVLAIRLVGKNAPALLLRASGAAPGDAAQIRVGMTFDEIVELAGSDGAKWDKRYGTNYMIVYHYFYRLGFGVRVADSGRVTEIIVAQLPADALVKPAGG